MTQSESCLPLASANLADILAADDWESLLARVKRLLSGSGIDEFLLRLDAGVADGSTGSRLFGTLPAELADLFDPRRQDQSDAVNRHLARSGLPLAWTVEALCGPGCAPAYPALKAHGLGYGTSFTVRGAVAVSRLDFYRRAERGAPLPGALTADLMLLASYLHEAVHGLWKRQGTHPIPTLTERERECLYWSAGGKTSKETAMILGISPHTVYFHLKNVASKFNVYSTRHAISRASRMGMLAAQPR